MYSSYDPNTPTRATMRNYYLRSTIFFVDEKFFVTSL